jgi:hypothetical protein
MELILIIKIVTFKFIEMIGVGVYYLQSYNMCLNLLCSNDCFFCSLIKILIIIEINIVAVLLLL